MKAINEIRLVEKGLKSGMIIPLHKEDLNKIKKKNKIRTNEEVSDILLNSLRKILKEYKISNKNLWFSMHRADKGAIIHLTKGARNFKKKPSARDLLLKDGKICGYPICCIKKFIEDCDDPKFISNGAIKRYRKQVKELGYDPYEFELWKGGYDSDKICHIPCSPLCKRTQKLAEKYSIIIS